MLISGGPSGGALDLRMNGQAIEQALQQVLGVKDDDDHD
jgi:hypothetical protein